MIRADHLTKRFGPITAIEDLSFEVRPGEVLGFLGPNGAGKSTTLRILSGFWPPTAGRASIDGHDLGRQSLQARRRLGYLPENFIAPPELRVAEYLGFRAGLKGLGRASRARSLQVMEQLGLGERRRQPFGALSKGYRQRVGLADALLAEPPALLLDEPFNGLDPLQRQEFREFLRRLAGGGQAILFSSHVLPEVEAMADRVLVIHEGRVRASGTPTALAERWQRAAPLALAGALPPEDLRAALLADPVASACCAELRVDGDIVEVELAAPGDHERLFRRVAEAELGVREIRLLRPTLEDLFERVIREPEGEA